jgi:membrane fusion protein (multidrug efflux system)
MRRLIRNRGRTRLEARSRHTLIGCFAACLCSVIVLGTGCGDPGDTTSDKTTDGTSDEEQSKAITVEALRVVPQPFVYRVALTGQLNAEYSVVLKPEREGVVESFHGIEGQPVEKGFILFQLRDGTQRARVQEAEAELRLAKDVHARTRRLSTQDISSAAKQAEAQAKLDRAAARLELARVDLERTRIRAPFDGVLGSRLVSPGATLDEKDGMISVDAVERLQVAFTVPENQVSITRLGARIHARVAAFPDEQFPGEVFFISPSIDPATRRLVMKAWVPNTEGKLKPGMFANVDIDAVSRDDALLVPESAMVYDRHGAYVWRVDSDLRAEKVPVEIGLRQDGQVMISSGIQRDDWVITAGTNKVLAGKRVDFAGAEAAATAQSSSPRRPPVTGEDGAES